jgi:ABC-type phosphate transport system substrate-binding protein
MAARFWFGIIAGIGSLVATLSCSLVIDRDSNQCETDNDCVSFPGTGCDTRVHICRKYTFPTDSGTVNPGGGETSGDAGPPCGVDGGCYACTPTTDLQFANACTDAKCQPFDNGARLKRLPGDGGLTPLPDAPMNPSSIEAGAQTLSTRPPTAGEAGARSAGERGPSATPSAVDCATMANPVFIVGSSAVKPFLAEIAKAERNQMPPVTVLYADQGSCVGVAAILSGTTAAGPFTYWDSAGVEQSCAVASPVGAHIGVSDVFATTCTRLPGGLPSNVGDFLGPVQPMTFVVPKSSVQTSISAEGAYYVYGFGAGSGVDPFTDETRLFQRDALSGTQRMIATAIGVDATLWRGTRTTGSGDMKTKVSITLPSEGTLGILSADVAQESRSSLQILAYQHFDQRCGYYPDKTESSNEKLNVRDGHYTIWGPLHLFTLMTSSGYPASAQAGDVIGFMTGTRAAPEGLDLVALEAQRHVVPQCAMRVSRTEEIGPLSSFAPPQACGCYYEKVANGSTSCTPCQNKTDCPSSSPFCNYGYCEMH